MAFIIDLIIVAIILLFTLLGYKRGLIKVAIKLCTFFIAIIVAFIIYKPVATLVIENTSVDESIEKAITDKMLPDGASEDNKIDSSLNLPNIILKNTENTVKSVAVSFSTTIIEITCFFVILITVKIVLKFVTALADLIAKLPILKQFNKLGGTIYGVLESLFIVFVGFAIISVCSPLLDNSLIESINSSTLGSIFYNNNVILNFIIR